MRMSFVIGFLMLVSQNVLAANILVVGSGEPYATIAGAVSAAQAGDTIRVKPGIYYESFVVDKENLTIEAFDHKNPPIVDGSHQSFTDAITRGLLKWEAVTDTIYRIKYSWAPRVQVTPEIYKTYFGGKRATHVPLMVYEDGVLLRGYRHRAYPHPYEDNADLDPANDEGDIENKTGKLNPLPDDWVRPSIHVHGRFRYDEASGYLYVWTKDSDHPNNHTYNIPDPSKLHLVEVRAQGVVLRHLYFRYSPGYAVKLTDAFDSSIENNFFYGNHYPIWLAGINNDRVVIKDNFIREDGFRERYWYRDVKETLLWAHAIDIEGKILTNVGGVKVGQYASDIKIFRNTINNCYIGIAARSQNISIYENIISKCISVGVNLSDIHFPTQIDFNARVYDNIIHDMTEGAFAFSLLPKGPIYIYRNIVYASQFLVKDGAFIREGVEGKTYVYHNTAALIRTLTNYPYNKPEYRNTVFLNNMVHSRFRRYETLFHYWKIGDCSNVNDCDDVAEWNFTPFTNGPIADYTLFDHKPVLETNRTIASFTNRDPSRMYIDPNQPGVEKFSPIVYTKDGFSALAETGLEKHGLLSSLGLAQQSLLDTADAFATTFDEFSESDMWAARGNYTKSFQSAYAALRDMFATSGHSPAIDRGCNISSSQANRRCDAQLAEQIVDLPDSVSVTDQYPDIGAFEVSASNSSKLGHWTFNEGVGAQAYDASGSLYDGLIWNPSWGEKSATDKYLEFNGVDSLVLFVNTPLLMPRAGDFTLIADIRVTNGNGGTLYSLGSYQHANEFAWSISPAGKLRFATANAWVDSSISVADGDWHQVSVVRDGSALRMFVDGNYRGGDSAFFDSSMDFGSTGKLVRLGALDGSYSDGSQTVLDRFSGDLDEVAYFATALNRNQLKSFGSISIADATAGCSAPTQLAKTGFDPMFPMCMIGAVAMIGRRRKWGQ